MDTSKEYIKMCEKAEEIQKLEEFQIGDFLWRGKKYLYEACVCDKIPCFRDNEKIWLPRQDQLQEMRFHGKAHPDAMIYLYEQWRQTNSDYILTFKTMEQVLLAELMEAKFKKVWDGIEWRKEE